MVTATLSGKKGSHRCSECIACKYSLLKFCEVIAAFLISFKNDEDCNLKKALLPTKDIFCLEIGGKCHKLIDLIKN